MMPDSKIEVIDITKKSEYEKYLYKCLAPMPFREYKKRHNYLEAAVPKGFHKKLLIFNREVVGQIEYASAEVSGYPIMGDNNFNGCVDILDLWAPLHAFGSLPGMPKWEA